MGKKQPRRPLDLRAQLNALRLSRFWTFARLQTEINAATGAELKYALVWKICADPASGISALTLDVVQAYLDAESARPSPPLVRKPRNGAGVGA